jgi:hypothetical protein
LSYHLPPKAIYSQEVGKGQQAHLCPHCRWRTRVHTSVILRELPKVELTLEADLLAAADEDSVTGYSV